MVDISPVTGPGSGTTIFDRVIIANGGDATTSTAAVHMSLTNNPPMTLTINNCTIANNTYLAFDTTGVVAVNISNSMADGNPGVFSAAGTLTKTITIVGNTFTSNVLSGGTGAVANINVIDQGTVNISNNVFTDNSVVTGKGGCVYLVAPASSSVALTVGSNTATGNIAALGAFLAFDYSKLAADIHLNTLTSQQYTTYGGNFYFHCSDTGTITGTSFSFTQNQVNDTTSGSSSRGTFVYLVDSNTVTGSLTSNTFYNNSGVTLLEIMSSMTLTSSTNVFDSNTNTIADLNILTAAQVPAFTSQNDEFKDSNSAVNMLVGGFDDVSVTALKLTGMGSGTGVQVTTGQTLTTLTSQLHILGATQMAVTGNNQLVESNANSIDGLTLTLTFATLTNATIMTFNPSLSVNPSVSATITPAPSGFDTTAQCYTRSTTVTQSVVSVEWLPATCPSLTSFSTISTPVTANAVYVLAAGETMMATVAGKVTLQTGCIELIGGLNLQIDAATTAGSTLVLIDATAANCLEGTFSSITLDNTANRKVCSATASYTNSMVTLTFVACPSITADVNNATGVATITGNRVLYSGEKLLLSSSSSITLNGYLVIEGEVSITPSLQAVPSQLTTLITATTIYGTAFSAATLDASVNPMMSGVTMTVGSTTVGATFTAYPSLVSADLSAPLTGSYGLFSTDIWNISSETTVVVNGNIILLGSVHVVISADVKVNTSSTVLTVGTGGNLIGTFSSVTLDNSQNPDIQSVTVDYLPSVKRDGQTVVLNYVGTPPQATPISAPTPTPGDNVVPPGTPTPGGLGAGPIVGIVIGSVVFVALVVMLLVYLLVIRKRGDKSEKKSDKKPATKAKTPATSTVVTSTPAPIAQPSTSESSEESSAENSGSDEESSEESSEEGSDEDFDSEEEDSNEESSSDSS